MRPSFQLVVEITRLDFKNVFSLTKSFFKFPSFQVGFNPYLTLEAFAFLDGITQKYAYLKREQKNISIHTNFWHLDLKTLEGLQDCSRNLKTFKLNKFWKTPHDMINMNFRLVLTTVLLSVKVPKESQIKTVLL